MSPKPVAKRTACSLLVAGGLLLSAAGSASAITLVGTDGRDVVSVSVSAGQRTALVITPAYVYSPPTNGRAEDASCATTVDPLTLRPIDVRCQLSGAYLLSVDLKGGDDQLRVRVPPGGTFSAPGPTSITIDGGAGADTIAVEAERPAALIRGGDGDDVLAATGEAGTDKVSSATTGSRAGPTFDGGPGRDLVDYVASGPDDFIGPAPEGVSVNLDAGTASFALNRDAAGAPSLTRDDRLLAIERVAGTPSGDILIGSKNADELIGNGGPDRLDGREGDDVVSGGDDEDLLVGGPGKDTLDGGAGLDEFPAGSGGDTLLARDGAQEKLTCVKDDTVVDDLTDQVNASACLNVSTAARVHVLDTVLTRRALTAEAGGAVRTRISCPALKAESCTGLLRLRLGAALLAQRRYSLRPGHALRARLVLSSRSLARARGRRVTLEAAERDDAGRPRSVVSRVRLQG
jgi:hypothetical protein